MASNRYQYSISHRQTLNWKSHNGESHRRPKEASKGDQKPLQHTKRCLAGSIRRTVDRDGSGIVFCPTLIQRSTSFQDAPKQRFGAFEFKFVSTSPLFTYIILDLIFLWCHNRNFPDLTFDTLYHLIHLLVAKKLQCNKPNRDSDCSSQKSLTEDTCERLCLQHI